jgi:hypothetical protein
VAHAKDPGFDIRSFVANYCESMKFDENNLNVRKLRKMNAAFR